MMFASLADPIFLFRLFLSFLLGGSYVAFTLWIAEKFGSRLGGLLGGLPSTILVSLAFIAWNQGDAAVRTATAVAPAMLAACSFFLVVFIYSHKYGRSVAAIAGLLVWFLVSVVLVTVGVHSIFISIAIALIFIGISILSLEKFLDRKLPATELRRGEFLFRVFVAGGFVALAVFVSKLLGPVWGGMMASFPAGFLSSMLLLERKHGIAFAASVAKNMPYGNIAIILFLLVLFLLIPVAGTVWAMITGYLASLLAAFFINTHILARRLQ
jgi:uncharacterized membrane protein (GlpM family)